MSYVHRFMVVPDAHVSVAREVARQLAEPPAADGLWTIPYRTKGTTTTTDWVSSGYIDAQFASILGDANSTFFAYQAKGGSAITLAQIQAMYQACPMGSRIRLDAQGKEQACLDALNIEPVPNVSSP